MAGSRHERPPNAQHLVLVSHNANGLRHEGKRQGLFAQLAHHGRHLVAVLPEVHSGGDDEVNAWLATAMGKGRPWGGKAFWAHGRPGTRGVAV